MSVMVQLSCLVIETLSVLEKLLSVSIAMKTDAIATLTDPDRALWMPRLLLG